MLLPGLATFLLIGLVLINPFTEKLFYFDLAEGYVEGPWYKLMYYSAICHMAAAFIRIMDEFGIPHDWIQFEITETVATEYNGSLKKVADDFTAAGVRLCLDDFGSGMASFKYLQQLPVDYLKIDGSFVKDMLQNPCNRAMVDAINHIGHVMGKKTIAEFVTDDATFKALQDMGVDYAQGYHIARPVPFDAAYFRKPPRVQTDSAVDQ